MNGGKITNMAPGTESWDAVNWQQWDQETALRIEGDLSEQHAREVADQVLADQLVTEFVSRAIRDTELDSAIAQETNARIAGDASERMARGQADAAIVNALASESADRVDTDSKLFQMIDALDFDGSAVANRFSAEEIARTAAIAAESEAREAADAVLKG